MGEISLHGQFRAAGRIEAQMGILGEHRGSCIAVWIYRIREVGPGEKLAIGSSTNRATELPFYDPADDRYFPVIQVLHFWARWGKVIGLLAEGELVYNCADARM